jgi:Double zinc ribbon
MRCPRCQQVNRQGARFCGACGRPLDWSCPPCGNQPPPGAAFCDRCGTSLAGSVPIATSPLLKLRPKMPQAYTPPHLAEKILAPKAALEGERKQVTVLFGDLKGSMGPLADRDSEEARQLLDPVLEGMMADVHRFDGAINQDPNGGVMILFGAPIAHEDNPQRQVHIAAMNRSWRSVTGCEV